MTEPRHPRAAAIAQAVAEHGWHVQPDFLNPAQVARLAAEARTGWDEGEFRPAGVGRGERYALSPRIRGDHIRWIEDARGPLADFQAELEALRLAVNRETLLGLFEFEGHFAVYPPGTSYSRHLDQFEGDAARRLSCVLYLNEHWQPEHGGALRLYLEGEEYVDVAPRGGTLVTFLSDRFYHEVLRNTVERFSLTGWFRTRT